MPPPSAADKLILLLLLVTVCCESFADLFTTSLIPNFWKENKVWVIHTQRVSRRPDQFSWNNSSNSTEEFGSKRKCMPIFFTFTFAAKIWFLGQLQRCQTLWNWRRGKMMSKCGKNRHALEFWPKLWSSRNFSKYLWASLASSNPHEFSWYYRSAVLSWWCEHSIWF